MQLKRISAVLAVLAILLPGCQGSRRVRRLHKAEVQERLRRLETPGLVIGEFPLARDAVVDGDTIKVAGLDTSLRLLAIDTEETFKSEEDRRLYEQGFDEYLEAKRGGSSKPVKVASPLGEDAKHFAEEFFEGINIVRIERDHPKDIRGRFNRYLAYVFVQREGEWVNYNIECVRAGMSPYFTKYSFSRRFHDQFVAAQEEARQKGLGIWDPQKEHYRDYPERIKWWNARAEFIKKFEKDAEGRDNYIVLTHWDSLRRLEQHENQQVVLLAVVGEIKIGDRGPTRVMLGRRLLGDFPLIFFDRDVLGSSNIARWGGEPIRVTGTVTRYRNRHTNKDELQMVVSLPGQISGPELVPDYSGWDGEAPAEQAELDEEQHMREHLYQEVD